MPAKAIAQACLDEVAAIVPAGDGVACCCCGRVCRPFRLVTPDDLCSILDGSVGLLHAPQVTDVIRIADAAERIDRDPATARHATHLQSGITPRLAGDCLRAASITNALSNSRWPLMLPPLGADRP